MRVLVISESFIIRDSVQRLFVDLFEKIYVDEANNLDDIITESLSLFNIIFIDIDSIEIDEIRYVIENKLEDTKIMIFDNNGNVNIFYKVIRLGVDAYISNIYYKDDFLYIINKVIKGKKFFDSELVEHIEDKNNISKAKSYKAHNTEGLSKKEYEVFIHVCKGMKNKEIADMLEVTEYTIKKHISSIFYKYNVKSRRELIMKNISCKNYN